MRNQSARLSDKAIKQLNVEIAYHGKKETAELLGYTPDMLRKVMKKTKGIGAYAAIQIIGRMFVHPSDVLEATDVPIVAPLP